MLRVLARKSRKRQLPSQPGNFSLCSKMVHLVRQLAVQGTSEDCRPPLQLSGLEIVPSGRAIWAVHQVPDLRNHPIRSVHQGPTFGHSYFSSWVAHAKSRKVRKSEIYTQVIISLKSSREVISPKPWGNSGEMSQWCWGILWMSGSFTGFSLFLLHPQFYKPIFISWCLTCATYPSIQLLIFFS